MKGFATRGLGCVVGLSLLAGQWGNAAPQKGDRVPVQGKVGLVTRDFVPTQRRNWRGVAEHRLHTVVWYPAAATARETPLAIGPPEAPLFTAGSAMPHAAFAPSMEPLPLVLLSHDTGSSAEQMAWLGTALARAGFVAAAVDHPGNNANGSDTAEGFSLIWERATDLSEILDGLLADPELGPHVDRERVGAAGYSLGGYTVLAMGGARMDLSALAERCRKEITAPACHLTEARGLGTMEEALAAARKTSGESLARSGESFADPRVRAVMALAPVPAFALTPESLRAMRVPVQLLVGSADAIAVPKDNADYVRAHVRGARETTLPGVAHYTFLDTCTARGAALLPALCTDPAGVSREAVHAEVGALAVGFFEKSLRGR